MEQVGRRAIAVDDSEKITTEHEQANLIHKQRNMSKHPLAPPSLEEEEEVYLNDVTLEDYPESGWKLCQDCLDGNFRKSPERVLKGARQAIGVIGSEKITKQDELAKLAKEASENMDEADFSVYWSRLYQKRPLPPPSIEEWENAWSLEEFARRGWKLCPDCLRGNFYERPEGVVKFEGQTIVVNGSEKFVSNEELAKIFREAEHMDDKEFYPYLDSLFPKRPLAPEECDNASSPDEQLVGTVGLANNTCSRRKKIKNKRTKETPSLWTFKLFKRRVTRMRSK